MDITRDQQIALDDALVAPTNRLKIGKSNLQLSLDLNSKEVTLQVVYDVLKLTPFYKAFQITTDVLEIYMQEFWATATVHHHSIHFRMNNKKHIVNLNHSGEIKVITNVNVNKLHQPWRSFAAVINMCLSEAEQMKLATKRSLIETHSSHASGSGADEGTGSKPGVPDVPTYGSDVEQISWKSSDEEFDDEVAKNDDDSGYPMISNLADIIELEILTDDKDNDEEIQDTNVEGDEHDEEETNEEDKENELYRDVNANLVGIDTEMTYAPCTIIQTTQVIEETHVIITPVNPEDVSVTTVAEPPLLSATLPPPPTPLITHLQQTPIPTPANVPSSSLQDLPNFGSLFSRSIAVQLQSDRLRDEAQAENADFINKLDDNIKKIIKDQVKEQVKAQVSKILPKIEKTVNEQLEAEVLTRSSNESKISYAVAANLSELELKKILIDKMERYKRRAGKEPESTSAPKEKTSKTTGKSTEGSKSYYKSVDESSQAEEPMQTAKDLEEPAHQEFKTRVTEDQPDEETSQLPDWFQKLAKPPTPDRDWNKTFDRYGYIRNHKKTIKNKQARTRERKSEQKPEAKA
ncbi:hypothetical protein Tco_0884363 [Tanacetum coccineum]